MKVKTKEQILAKQRTWADNSDVVYDHRSYVDSIEDNLFQNISIHAKDAFEEGGGSELEGTPSKPAKIKALHSSAALVLNVFDYWVDRNDRMPLKNALGLQASIQSVEFEQKFPTGLRGKPPHLDVVITDSNDNKLALESKFTEWLEKKKPSISNSYFCPPIWTKHGLPACQKLADSIHEDLQCGRRLAFEFLDVAQLLKHALGLANSTEGNFSLWYVYYEESGSESEAHSREVMRFQETVDEKLNFRAVSYQEIFRDIKANARPEDQDYITYLEERYF